MNLFHDLERQFEQRLRKLFQSEPVPGEGKELVEVQRAILDAVDARIQLLPRARRAFPFNEVTVRIPVTDPDRRAAYELVFVEDDALASEIKTHLERENVEFPPDLGITVHLLDTAEITEPALVCRKREQEAPPRKVADAAGSAKFIMPDGEIFETSKGRIHIGRLPEVLDDRGRLVRRNDIVIEDKNVSRAHAHVDRIDGEFRLFDDGSSYGTSVIHNGRLVDVPKAGGRGLRLDAGDEIYFGKVRVRFEPTPET